MNKPLTNKQMMLAMYVRMGYSNPEIAAMMNVTRGTVKLNLRAIYSKLGFHTNGKSSNPRVALAVWYVNHAKKERSSWIKNE